MMNMQPLIVSRNRIWKVLVLIALMLVFLARSSSSLRLLRMSGWMIAACIVFRLLRFDPKVSSWFMSSSRGYCSWMREKAVFPSGRMIRNKQQGSFQISIQATLSSMCDYNHPMHFKNNHQSSPVPFPTHVPLPSLCKQVVAGAHHSYAVSSEAVYLWGAKPLHQADSNCSPEELATIAIQVEQLATGPTHTFAWNNHQVYCWGSNQYYELGLQQEHSYPCQRVQLFQMAFQQGRQLQTIACGQHHTLAVFRNTLLHPEQDNYQGQSVLSKESEDTEDNIELFGWGQSSSYQLTLNSPHIIPEPVISPCSFHNLQQIHSRSDYNVALCNHTVYSWGCNLFSRLGINPHSLHQGKVRIPKPVPLSIQVVSLGIGTYHVVALAANGEGYAWGKGNQGQLGINRLQTQSQPTRMECSEHMIDVACGEAHTLVLLKDGRILSCGSNSQKALGHNCHDPQDKKKRCWKLEEVQESDKVGKVNAMSCGVSHNLVLNQEGKVFAWGSNAHCEVLPVIQAESQPIHRSMKHPRKSLQIIVDEVNEFKSQSKITSEDQATSRLLDWRKRYEEFKVAKRKQQEALMAELDDILGGMTG